MRPARHPPLPTMDSIHEFAAVVDDKRELFRLLMKSRVVARYRRCPDCDRWMHAKQSAAKRYERTGGWYYKCNSRQCSSKKGRSILYGTMWYKSKLTLENHLFMLYYWSLMSQSVCSAFLFPLGSFLNLSASAFCLQLSAYSRDVLIDLCVVEDDVADRATSYGGFGYIE